MKLRICPKPFCIDTLQNSQYSIIEYGAGHLRESDMKRFFFTAILCALTATQIYCHKIENREQDCSSYKDYVVTVESLNIREAPGKDAKVIAGLKQSDRIQACASPSRMDTIDGNEAAWFRVKMGNSTGWVFGAYLLDTNLGQASANVIARQEEGRILIVSKNNPEPCIVPVPQGASVIIDISDKDDFVALSPGTDVFRALLFVETASCRMIKIDSVVELGSGSGRTEWEEGAYRYRKVSAIPRRPGNDCPRWTGMKFQNGKEEATGESGMYPKGSHMCM